MQFLRSEPYFKNLSKVSKKKPFDVDNIRFSNKIVFQL